MSERLDGVPITRVRQELEASDTLNTLVRAFLQQPAGQTKWYTTAQRDLQSNDPNKEELIGAADRVLRDMANRALVLGGQVHVSETADGLRLTFDVRDRDQWMADSMARAMNEIEWRENEGANTRVYTVLGRTAITNDEALWRSASRRLIGELSTEEKRERLQLKNVRLKRQEVIGYQRTDEFDFPDKF